MTSYCNKCGEKLGIGNIVVSAFRKGSLLLCYPCKRKEISKISKTSAFFNVSAKKRVLRRFEL